MRMESVCNFLGLPVYSPTPLTSQRHVFRQPAKPIEPPTPRVSLLGLDRLAQEKRAANHVNDPCRKKPRLDNGSEPIFKGLNNHIIYRRGSTEEST